MLTRIARIIARMLPYESRLRDLLATVYYRYYNPLYSLAEADIISRIWLVSDNIISCRLYDGTKFYAPPDKVVSRGIRYGKRSRLREIKNFPYFGGFFAMLNEIWVEDSYQTNYHLGEGMFVVDAGANIGLFTVKAARIVGKGGKIIAIEP